MSDVFNIGDKQIRVSFGCETKESGEIYNQVSKDEARVETGAALSTYLQQRAAAVNISY